MGRGSEGGHSEGKAGRRRMSSGTEEGNPKFKDQNRCWVGTEKGAGQHHTLGQTRRFAVIGDRF